MARVTNKGDEGERISFDSKMPADVRIPSASENKLKAEERPVGNQQKCNRLGEIEDIRNIASRLGHLD
jgi:hypothetical protein